jgi:signal transduction histidine kinase/CheY-like chemotaxis protein
MVNDNLHSYFGRQLKKHVDAALIEQNASLQKLIEIVNQSYLNYEKDAELFEKSIRLNDIEFNKVNQKLKDQLNKNKAIQSQLFYAIKQLDTSNNIIIDDYDNADQLFQILKDEIEFKKKYEVELYEAKIIAEKANDAKSDFLSIMSHEIRTPLNAIVGLTYIIENETDIEAIHDNINFLKKSAQNLHHLINNILDFNKIEKGKVTLEKTPFNYAELVTDITRFLESNLQENKDKIKITIDADFNPNLIGDPLRISQIITNLLANAIKFTKNGLIEIKITTLTKTASYITFKTEVIDSGIGIDYNHFEKLFQKFSQIDSSTSREYGGSGLGLVITKNLLHLLNSEIDIKSEVGKGSNFNFVLTLPLQNMQANNADHGLSEQQQIQMLDGMKVLLVEDNIINIKVAEKILNQWNVEVDVAQNGLLGLEKFHANEHEYDVILMDLSMPVMDGYEASAKIRLVNSTIPIIALTASTSYLSLEKALQIGANEYITKPFIPKELNAKLSRYYKI